MKIGDYITFDFGYLRIGGKIICVLTVPGQPVSYIVDTVGGLVRYSPNI